MSYKQIKAYIQDNIGAQVTYNAIYVVKSCIVGSAWIGFDDVEVVKMKVSYAKQNKLLGYVVWQLSYDDNSELSLAGTYIRDRSMQQT
jgi:GH18 family chitinase